MRSEGFLYKLKAWRHASHLMETLYFDKLHATRALDKTCTNDPIFKTPANSHVQQYVWVDHYQINTINKATQLIWAQFPRLSPPTLIHPNLIKWLKTLRTVRLPLLPLDNNLMCLASSPHNFPIIALRPRPKIRDKSSSIRQGGKLIRHDNRA